VGEEEEKQGAPNTAWASEDGCAREFWVTWWTHPIDGAPDRGGGRREPLWRLVVVDCGGGYSVAASSRADEEEQGCAHEDDDGATPPMPRAQQFLEGEVGDGEWELAASVVEIDLVRVWGLGGRDTGVGIGGEDWEWGLGGQRTPTPATKCDSPEPTPSV
jgi:hypothetical protein